MIRKYTLPVILLGVLFILPFSVLAAINSVRAVSLTRYSKAHSLGDNYVFDPRDGWESVNVTNLPYKYTPFNTTANSTRLERRSDRNKNKPQATGLGGILKTFWDGLKAFGNAQPVEITWYTGNDLLNPSCWANGKWAPTDKSFACALTEIGWQDRPQCFKFIELCHTNKRCVFVRVVDTCAGCKAGTRHVDLTRAAFGQLAGFYQGRLTVYLRSATDPTNWSVELWGPKATSAAHH